MVSSKSPVSTAKREIEKGDHGSHARNDRFIQGTPKGIQGNDLSRPSRGARPYLGQCVGVDLCYFIGNIEMYNLITEATKRAGLENPFRYFRALSDDKGGAFTLGAQTQRA